MKFTTALSTALLLAPLVSQVTGRAVYGRDIEERAGRFGGFRGGQGQNRGGNQKGAGKGAGAGAAAGAGAGAAAGAGAGAAAGAGNAAAASTSVAAAASSAAAATSVAAAASSAAAASAAAASTSAAASNNAGGGAAAGNSDGDPQTSLTLDSRVIASGFANNGQDVPTAGQVAALTSTNNFINFCLTVPNLPITNGQQVTTGSCNPAPIGVIPSTSNMPSAKFAFPKNGDVIQSNTAFNPSLNVINMQLGNFTNAKETYYANPQTLNAQGQVIGHTHILIESLSSLQQTDPTDPTTFVFFKGIDQGQDANNNVQTNISAGLPAGFYRMCTINSAATHQPVVGPIAQHGSFDDCSYFTATDDASQVTAQSNVGGGNNAGAGAAAGSTAATTAAAGAADTTAAAGAAATTAAAATGATGAGNAAAGTGNAAAGTGNAATGGNAGKGGKGKFGGNKGGRRFIREY